jgi:hypothetical protein
VKISATILLKGTPRRLGEVLSALKDFDEILLYDNGATQEACAICKQLPNAHIVQGPFQGFGIAHNIASSLARNDWILSIDSDEVATKELVSEIQNLTLDPRCVYSVPRHNVWNGKWIRWCGWHPDRVIRLYHRSRTQFTESLVHEAIKTDGCTEIALKSPLIHYSYDTLSDFLGKMQSYSDLFAAEHAGKKSSSPGTAVLHALGAFFKSFFLKRGFCGGYEGFLISMYQAQTAFFKYLKLYEANCSRIRRCPEENAKRSNSSWDAQI